MVDLRRDPVALTKPGFSAIGLRICCTRKCETCDRIACFALGRNQLRKPRDADYDSTRILCTISAFSFTSSFMRGYMPTKIPSLALRFRNAVRNAPSIPSGGMRPAARILNAKQVLLVCRITLYILGGSLCR